MLSSVLCVVLLALVESIEFYTYSKVSDNINLQNVAIAGQGGVEI